MIARTLSFRALPEPDFVDAVAPPDALGSITVQALQGFVGAQMGQMQQAGFYGQSIVELLNQLMNGTPDGPHRDGCEMQAPPTPMQQNASNAPGSGPFHGLVQWVHGMIGL